MFTNILKIAPVAPAEKNCSQELQNHQSLGACTGECCTGTSPTNASPTGASAQGQTWLHSNATNEAGCQDCSDYISHLLAPSVTLPRLHQDFTQPSASKAAVSELSEAFLPSSHPGSFLDWASHWISRWWNGSARKTNAHLRSEPIAAKTEGKLKGTTHWMIAPAQPARAQINQRGLGLLRQFEPMPSYSEQTLREIEEAVLRQVKVPLTSNQFSALVSLTYSLGEANLRRSTLLKYLNAGCYQAAAQEFDRWVYVGPNRLPALVARRAAERKLFLQTH